MARRRRRRKGEVAPPVETEEVASPVSDVVPGRAASITENWIAELPLDPRQPSRYATGSREDGWPLLTYRDVLQDERCAAALDQRLDAVVSKPWEVQPGGRGRAVDVAAAEDLREQLEAIDFARVCRQMLYAVWFGFSVAECLWEVEGARVRLAALCPRAQTRFRWEGCEIRLRSGARPWGEPLPEAKFVVLTRPGDHDDVPFYPGLARWCFWPAYLKRLGLQFWAVALERYGTPTAWATYQRGNKEERDRLLKILESLTTAAAIALPEGQTLQALQAMARENRSYQDFCDYLDRSITTTILGQSSTTDQGPWKGTAEVQRDVRDEVIASDARLLDNALSGSVAVWLTRWNHPTATPPVIHHEVEPPEDLDRRSTIIQRLADATGYRPTIEEIQDVFGGDWEQAPAPGASPSSGAPGGPEFAAADGDAIDAAADEVAAEWRPMLGPLIEPVLAAGRDAGGYEDFQRRVTEALGDDPDTTRVAETLWRQMFSAAVSGQTGGGDDAAD